MNIFDWLIAIVIIFLFVFILGSVENDARRRSDEQDEKVKAFVKDCLESGGRVDQIGHLLFSYRLVCNPK